MTMSNAPFRPVIGLMSYRKVAAQATPIPLFALMPSYSEAVEAAGGAPLMIPLGLDEETLDVVLDRIDGLLLTGGGDMTPSTYRSNRDDLVDDTDPDRDRVEIYLARRAMAIGKPTLAICRGHQVLNVALGGTLYEDVRQMLPGAMKHDYFGEHPRNYRPHDVTIVPDGRLAQLLPGTERLEVNSLHHQGIRDLAPALDVTAVASDGLIEGVAAREHPFAVGVQWHPENLIHDDPRMLALFRALVSEAVAQRDATLI